MDVLLTADAIVWLLLTIVFVIAEGVTTAMISVWFAIGAAAALVTSVFTDSWLLQTFVFLAVSAVVLFAFRPYAMRQRKTGGVQTNFETNIGKIATVLTPIQPGQVGRVRLEGVDWNAVSNSPLEVNAPCRVTDLQGTTLTVVPVETQSTVHVS